MARTARRRTSYVRKRRYQPRPYRRVIARKGRSAKAYNFGRRNLGTARLEPAKRHVFSEYNVRNTRTLYFHRMDAVPFGANNEIDTRQRNIMWWSGTKLHFEVTNFEAAPLYLNVAILHSRQQQGLAPPLTTQTYTTFGDFYRGNASSRSTDFSDSLSALDNRTLNINTDDWVVLKHKRIVVGQATNTVGVYLTGVTKNTMTFKWWVPIKRNLRYEDGDANGYADSNGEGYLVFWADSFNDTAGQTQKTGAYQFNFKGITFFKEPKN